MRVPRFGKATQVVGTPSQPSVAVGLFQREHSHSKAEQGARGEMASSAASGDVGPPAEAEPGAAVAPSPQDSVTSVKVAVRVRPLVGMETAQGCLECMFGDNDNNQVRRERVGRAPVAVFLCVWCSVLFACRLPVSRVTGPH